MIIDGQIVWKIAVFCAALFILLAFGYWLYDRFVLTPREQAKADFDDWFYLTSGRAMSDSETARIIKRHNRLTNRG